MNTPVTDSQESTEIDDEIAGTTSYSFEELLNVLQQERELILTIPQDEEQALREGLINKKNRQNQAMKEKNIEPPRETLKFNSYPAKVRDTQEIIPGQLVVHVSLKERKGVSIIKIERPDGEI